jgi:hypothetical protein
MTPEEVLSTLNLIKDALRTYDPLALLDLIQFPLQQCGRCPGDLIETPEEFVERFPALLDDTTRDGLLALPPEAVFISWRGVAMPVWDETHFDTPIWFEGFCDTADCDTTYVGITAFLGYCPFSEADGHITSDLVTTPTPFATYDPLTFPFGRYEVTSVRGGGLSLIVTEETLPSYLQSAVVIGPAEYTGMPPETFGPSCSHAQLEFCRAVYARGTALWYGIDALGELHVLCDGQVIMVFDILEGARLGYYLDSYYFVFERLPQP